MSNPETKEPDANSYSWNVSRTCRLQKIEITYAVDGDLTATTTTFNGEASYNVELGQDFTAPTASVDVEGASVTYSSSNTAVANVDANTGAVTLVGAGTTTIIASYAGDDTYAPSYASYTITVTKPVPVFESLEALAADETLESGDIVKVSFQDVAIKSIYVSSKNLRQGIYFDIQKGGNDIEIYYNSEEVPETWLAGGTVSGTMQCAWTLYNTTWELAPAKGEWSWSNLTYTAPAGAKEVATIEFESKSNLEVGSTDQYDVTYDGDGELSVASSNESVATVELVNGQVVVTALVAGTTTITVSATETEVYSAASEQYTLTVTPAKVPFSRDVHKALVAEKDGKFYAAYNTFEGSNTYFLVKEVTVSNNKVYGLTDAEAAELAWNVTVDGTSATVRNLDNEYLKLMSSGTKVYLSSNEVILFVAEDGSFHVDEGGRGFAYNVSTPRMSNYIIGTGYPAAVAMEFAAEGEVPTPTTANMKITAAQWGTFWAPFAVEIPAGVKAYTGEMKGDWIKMTEVEGVIPANTGVVVTSENVVDEDLQAVESDAAELQTCYTGNTTGAVMNVEQGAYLLQKQGEQVGWYKVSGEGFTLAPNRCYLDKDLVAGTAAESRTFIGFEPVDGDATGISTIASQAATKADGKYMVKGQIV
ncbi:MAG: Ig-like domain repeat protein, partial [Bacteroidaceae bacterium]|nr:Ig-like domain repeat protein [Bacteroidaceae bacterium]